MSKVEEFRVACDALEAGGFEFLSSDPFVLSIFESFTTGFEAEPEFCSMFASFEPKINLSLEVLSLPKALVSLLAISTDGLAGFAIGCVASFVIEEELFDASSFCDAVICWLAFDGVVNIFIPLSFLGTALMVVVSFIGDTAVGLDLCNALLSFFITFDSCDSFWGAMASLSFSFSTLVVTGISFEAGCFWPSLDIFTAVSGCLAVPAAF